MQPDEIVLNKIRDGDQGALATLYDHYRPLLFAYCVRILGNSQDAEDAVHDVFVKLPVEIRSLRDIYSNTKFLVLRNWRGINTILQGKEPIGISGRV